VAKIDFGQPFYQLSSTEEKVAKFNYPNTDPADTDVQQMLESATGNIVVGASNSIVGTMGIQLGHQFERLINPEDNAEPVNFTKSKSEIGINDPISYQFGNDPESIASVLQGIDAREYPYLLDAPTWSDFQHRVRLIEMKSPEIRAQTNAWGTVGTGMGLVGDLSGFIGVGLLAEPLVLTGLGTAAMAGQTASKAAGAYRVMSVASAASEAVGGISRVNMGLRYFALSAAEEGVFQGVRAGIDPTYHPEASEVVRDLVVAGTFGGLLGGVAFGRSFVAKHVGEAAEEMKRTRMVDLPGGYKIEWNGGFAFGSDVAYADTTLFAPGVRDLPTSTREVAGNLWADWQRSGANVNDLFIPGTRNVSVPVVPGGAVKVFATAGRKGMFWSADPKALGVGEVAGEGVASRILYPHNPIRITDWKSTIEELGYTRHVSMPTVIKRLKDLGHDVAIVVGRDGKESFLVLDKSAFGKRIGAAALKPGAITGVRSAMKAVAAEIAFAGGEVTEQTFTDIARVLVKLDGERLTPAAFNKRVWEEMSKVITPEVASKLRSTGRARIGGVDKTLMDIADKEDLVTSVLNNFRANRHLDEGAPDSLIFTVLEDVRKRGGTVNRQTVSSIIDDLRTIHQNPPRKTNTKGAKVLDFNARRQAVIDVINKHALDKNKIHISSRVLNNLGKAPVSTAAVAVGTGLGSDVPRVQNWYERVPLIGKYLNQAAVGLGSENNGIRLLTWNAFNARRVFDKAQPQTMMEAGTLALHNMTFRFLRGHRNGFAQFAMGDTAGADAPTISNLLKSSFGSKNRELMREFNARITVQLRSGKYDDANEAVNKTAKGIREMFDSAHAAANAVGLKGFTKALDNYMPRIYRWDRIRRLASTKEGKADLVALARQSLGKTERRVVVDGVEQSVKGDLDEAATVLTERWIAIATRTENAPMMAQDQELADALLALNAPIKESTGSPTPYGRARMILDEGATVPTTIDHLGNGKLGLSLADITNDDLPAVFRKYTTSVQGAINEKRLIDSFNASLKHHNVLGPVEKVAGKVGKTVQRVLEVTTIEDAIKTSLRLGGVATDAELAALREVVAAIKYQPIHNGAATTADKILGFVMPMGYLSTGGQFGLAAMGEIGRLVGTMGITNTMKQMPILAEMLSNYRNLDRETANFASLIDTVFSPATDRLRRSFTQIASNPDQYAGRVKRGLDAAANMMSDLSLLAPITSFTQQLTAATTIQHLFEVSRGLSKRMDFATIRSMGLEMDQYEKLIQFVGTNAKTKSSFFGERVFDMTRLDAIEMDDLRTFVDRMVRTRIQDMPTRGDFHKGMFSTWGKIFTQFRSFNLKGMDNFLAQNMSRMAQGGMAPKKQVVQEVGATLMLAGLIQYGRSYSAWSTAKSTGDRKKAAKLEEQLTLAGIIKGALTGPSEFFLPMFVADSAWTILADKDPIFAQYRYSGLGVLEAPSFALAKRGFSVAQDAYGATVGKAFGLDVEREVTQKSLHNIRTLLPGQNIPGIKDFLTITEKQISDYYNLRPTQPRQTSN
jgi:hypothetical protein